MTSKAKRTGVVLIALMVATTMVGGVAMAAIPSLDTETTNSPEATELNDNGEMNITKSGETKQVAIEVDSENPKAIARLDASGAYGDDKDSRVHEVTASEMTQTYANDTSSTYHYEFNLSTEAFESGDLEPNTTHQMELVLLNNSNASSPDVAYVTFNGNTSDSFSTSSFDQNDIDNGAAGVETTHTVNIQTLNWTLGTNENAERTERETLNTSGGHEHVINVQDADAASAFDADAEGVSDGKWVQGHSVVLTNADTGEKTGLKTYKNSAPSDTNGSYAVYNADTDTYTLNINDDVESGTYDISVRSTAFGWDIASSQFGFGDAVQAAL